MLRFRFRAVLLLFLMSCAAHAANRDTELLNAARDGDVQAVRTLMTSGANVNATDKSDRTPLMRAAQRGATEVVKALLAGGANAAARDKEGLTAYALALVSAGEDRKPELLALLPKPPVIRVSLTADWVAEDMASSCFQTREELAKTIAALRPDALVLGALADYARVWGRDVVEITNAEASGLREPSAAPTSGQAGDEYSVLLQVRPGISCVRQSDNLSMAIDLGMARAANGQPVFKKTFGAGLKGLHSQTVANAAQYEPFFSKWAKSHASSMYWEMLRAAFKSM